MGSALGLTYSGCKVTLAGLMVFIGELQTDALGRLKHVLDPIGEALSLTEPSHFDPYLSILSPVIHINVTLKSLADGPRPDIHRGALMEHPWSPGRLA